MTREILDKKYDELLERATSLMDKFNPCNIQVNSRGIATCQAYPEGDEHLCCRSSSRIDVDACNCKDGCQAKSLRCALWLCEFVNNGEFIDSSLLPTINVKRTIKFDSRFNFINEEHKAIFDEMIRYKLDRAYRQDKKATIEAALLAFKEEGE